MTDAKLQSTDVLNLKMSPTIQGQQLVQGHFQPFLQCNRLLSVSFLGQGPYFVFTGFNTTAAAKPSIGHLHLAHPRLILFSLRQEQSTFYSPQVSF